MCILHVYSFQFKMNAALRSHMSANSTQIVEEFEGTDTYMKIVRHNITPESLKGEDYDWVQYNIEADEENFGWQNNFVRSTRISFNGDMVKLLLRPMTDHPSGRFANNPDTLHHWNFSISEELYGENEELTSNQWFTIQSTDASMDSLTDTIGVMAKWLIKPDFCRFCPSGICGDTSVESRFKARHGICENCQQIISEHVCCHCKAPLGLTSLKDGKWTHYRCGND